MMVSTQQRTHIGNTARHPSVVIGALVSLTTFALMGLSRFFLTWPPRLWIGVGVALAAGVVAGGIGHRAHLAARDREGVFRLSGYAGAIGLITTWFLLIVLGLGRVPGDDERGLVVLAMLAALVGGIAFEPARRLVEHRLRSVMRLDRGEASDVLELFGHRIGRDLPIDEVLLQVAESLRDSMRFDSVEIWTGTGGAFELRTSLPQRSSQLLTLDEGVVEVVVRSSIAGRAWLKVWLPRLLNGRTGHIRVVPMTFGGELIGFIVVERFEEDANADEESVLVELGRQLALALHNTQLDHALRETLEEVRRQARELEASRRRLVNASDEERRRIERDLHDGAQQHLVALSVGLKVVSDLIANDPDSAVDMATQLQTTVQDVIEELRALAHGIYPPLLRDNGLGPALRAAAAQSANEILVEAGRTARYRADIESAVYFCCLEALQNVSKHACEASVRIVLGENEGGLFFTVSDDGPGFDLAEVVMSAGFTNMADRVGAVGGRVEWHSEPGAGVEVAGVIPLPR